jgi:hypothetical protein
MVWSPIWIFDGGRKVISDDRGTWVLASIGAVVEMGILSTLKRLLMEG